MTPLETLKAARNLKEPPPELLRKLLRYEPETGKLFWLPRDRSEFCCDRIYLSWTAKFSEKEAFTADSGKGYRQSQLFAKTQKAHRVIWAMQTGEWPKQGIDHIDRDRSNNAWSNLRLATLSENASNRSSSARSSSRFLGVSWCKRQNKWRANISYQGKYKSLGWFSSEVDAALAYDAMAKTAHGEFANLNFPDQQKEAA